MDLGAEERRQLHAWLSTSSLDAWNRFARSHGTNVTALLEALGHQLRDADDKELHRLPPLLRTAVVDSRRIAAERTSRHRG